MGSPSGCHVLRRSIIKSLLVPEIVRNRDRVRPSRTGDITGTGAIKAARRKEPNSHLEEALARGLAAVTGRPGSSGFPSVWFPAVPLAHAGEYKTDIELYQSIDL
jgi:hypothetical protein